MKRLFSLLLICLLLAGCGPVPEPTKATVTLPVPALPSNVLSPETASPETESPKGFVIGYNYDYCGAPFLALCDQVKDRCLMQTRNCLIWETEASLALSSVSPEHLMTDSSLRIHNVCAAQSEDGKTVTGLIRWKQERDGSWTCEAEGIEPLDQLMDPAELAGLPMEAVLALLGPCNADLGGDLSALCWFTRDGALLTVNPLGAVTLEHLLDEEPPVQTLPDPDTVYGVNFFPAKSTVVGNFARWEAFTSAASRGEPDAVTLRWATVRDVGNLKGGSQSVYFDGKTYTLTNTDGSANYAHLIFGTEDHPPAESTYSSVSYCLLSDDPEMTWERYTGSEEFGIGATDFPGTALLFTIYRFDD